MPISFVPFQRLRIVWASWIIIILCRENRRTHTRPRRMRTKQQAQKRSQKYLDLLLITTTNAVNHAIMRCPNPNYFRFIYSKRSLKGFSLSSFLSSSMLNHSVQTLHSNYAKYFWRGSTLDIRGQTERIVQEMSKKNIFAPSRTSFAQASPALAARQLIRTSANATPGLMSVCTIKTHHQSMDAFAKLLGNGWERSAVCAAMQRTRHQ